MMKFSINCADETMKTEYLTFYYTDGSSEATPGDGVWTPLAPETVGRDIMAIVCSWKPK
jgi:hypothetical protein